MLWCSRLGTTNTVDRSGGRAIFVRIPECICPLRASGADRRSELTVLERHLGGVDGAADRHERIGATTQDVRSRWTATHLYFLFVCPYEQLNLRPNPQTASDTNRLWEHDVLEVYIGSNFDDITKYLELQVSPQGEHLDGTIDATVPRVGIGNEWAWESGWNTHARLDRDKKVWYAEIQLPIASFDQRPVKRATNSVSISIDCRAHTLRPRHGATSWRGCQRANTILTGR